MGCCLSLNPLGHSARGGTASDNGGQDTGEKLKRDLFRKGESILAAITVFKTPTWDAGGHPGFPLLFALCVQPYQKRSLSSHSVKWDL